MECTNFRNSFEFADVRPTHLEVENANDLELDKIRKCVLRKLTSIRNPHSSYIDKSYGNQSIDSPFAITLLKTPVTSFSKGPIKCSTFGSPVDKIDWNHGSNHHESKSWKL